MIVFVSGFVACLVIGLYVYNSVLVWRGGLFSHPITFFVFSVVSCVELYFFVVNEAGVVPLVSSLSILLGGFLVACLSVYRGGYSRVSYSEIIIPLIGFCVGFFLLFISWVHVGLIVFAIIDVIGVRSSVKNVLHNAWSESIIFWGVPSVRNMIVIMFMTDYSFSSLWLQVVWLIVHLSMFILILWRRWFSLAS